MNLREAIVKEHSKIQCNRIVSWVGDDQKKFDSLFQLLISDDSLLSQRASWPVSNCVLNYPQLIENNFEKLIANLNKTGLHDAVKRNTVRLLQFIDIPLKHQGAVMNICFEFVASPETAVGIKAFSLSILGKLANQYPEIIPEIKLLIDEQLHRQTAAFKCRAKVLLKQFSKE